MMVCLVNIAPKESGLLQAANPFYKTFAIECSRAQVSVDMFLFSSAYQDVASLGKPHPYHLFCPILTQTQRICPITHPVRLTSTQPSMPAARKMLSNSHTNSGKFWLCPSCWRPFNVFVHHEVSCNTR